MNPTQVMIVEDEALIGMDIQENLINFGYSVVGISNSGEMAIENAVKTRPELVLMDIKLAGEMSGIDAARQIKKKMDIPIIFLTAYADDKTLSKAIETSPSGYLMKPFVPQELHSTIQAAIQKSNVKKKVKLDRLRYIQSNILKHKKLKDKINDSQLANPDNTSSNSETKKDKHLEKLLGTLIFSQEITPNMPYIIPVAEYTSLLEYSEDETVKMGNLIIPLLIHPEDFQMIEDYYKRLISFPKEVSEIDFRLKHKSGIWRWFNLRGVIRNSTKNQNEILHSTKDITWLKNLEYNAHIAREKFSAISNNPYFGIAILDLDAKILNINPTLELLTGYTKEDLNWLNCSDYIGLKEIRNICMNFEKLKLGSINSFETEAFIYTKHKGAFWGYMVFNAIYNQERIVDRILCTLVDISESKLFENKPKSK